MRRFRAGGSREQDRPGEDASHAGSFGQAGRRVSCRLSSTPAASRRTRRCGTTVQSGVDQCRFDQSSSDQCRSDQASSAQSGVDQSRSRTTTLIHGNATAMRPPTYAAPSAMRCGGWNRAAMARLESADASAFAPWVLVLAFAS